MKMMLKRFAWITALALLIAPASAFADITLDFAIGPTTGGLTFDPTTNTITASLPILNVIDSVTNTKYYINDGAGNPGTLTISVTGGSGPSFTVNGCVDSDSPNVNSNDCTAGDPGFPGTGALVFNGNFTSATLSAATGFFGFGTDNKDRTLTALYGAPNGTWDATINFAATCQTGCGTGGVEVWSTAAGDLNNTPAVPEPGSLALLSTGLIGAAGLIRRKLFS